MNFLAHIYLSGDDENIMIGNFIGDFVKGKSYEAYSSEIQKGILLHRDIDRYTDSHPKVIESKKLLWPKYRHYSGVLVDIFYDHFLASNWSDYHQTPLQEYSQQIYKILLSSEKSLPQGARYMLPYMIKGNWLYNYSHKSGIQKALSGMAKRTKFHSKMEEGVTELTQHYSTFEDHFSLFFEDIETYCRNWNKA